MNASIQVITVSYFSTEALGTMIDSLRTQTSSSLLIANNAPEDEMVQSIAGSGIEVVQMKANVGYGTAINMSIDQSGDDPDWYLMVNPDVTFKPGALDQLVAAGEADPSIGVLGPLIRDPTGQIYPSARQLPSLRSGIGHALFARTWKRNPWTLSYLADRDNPAEDRDAGWLSGSCLLVRRIAFEDVGGFDERFFMYFEDVDLCERIGRAGWRVHFVSAAEVVHSGGHSTLRPQVSRTMIRAHHRSAYIYLATRYTGWQLAPLRAILRVSLSLRSRLVR